MRDYDVTIKGVTALLQNKPPEYGFDSKLKIINPNSDEEKKALEKLYSIDGKIYQPSTHIWQSLIRAGADLKIKGRGKKTYSSMMGSMVQVSPDAIIHKNQKYEIYKILAVNPVTKGRMMTYRPMFKEWELSFNISCDEEIPEEVLKEALDRAGKYQGIGDWRPNKKGCFGKFIVTQFKLIKS